MDMLSLKIVTPEKIVFEDSVASITVMTQNGEITILPHHIPLVTRMRAGELCCKKNGEEIYLAASTGFLEVRPGNQVIILADTAERVEELELQKIESAKIAAQKLLEETQGADDVAFANALAGMERESARYKVAIKRRHPKTPPAPLNPKTS
ncbi:TPA: ATP synthase F1 subunit epsilon [Candidatus Uhrbacteria bacterium]|uniref:ATP synthase epsilon chain n=2 Tax=Candidatus Uhriibacteriota TaxID=1752732 RepID=A0A0G1Q7L4_9BACT|nr:MAG: ATP synthase epsilon chain [Candidatus Uhrbacteria bacterium GW2011_GWF2_46_218]KKU40989.1 MAG: ATP synthase epsilon chain [Candidatus Uhrbacteria bacterium GW2011_GWE2_46_68]HBK33651.1 ATP synthase F1 subunit epsilon [Candidatus Uhrbacteria bacterium]HCB18949.1 ATP synthase F1 subunit epsilon [Candidatus Uhrbacteria bacterium]